MEQNSDTSAEVVTLLLDPAEVLALYGFLALGAHFAAIISGEDSPFSPDEIRHFIATVGGNPLNNLMDKLARAATEVVSAAPTEAEVIRNQSRRLRSALHLGGQPRRVSARCRFSQLASPSRGWGCGSS